MENLRMLHFESYDRWSKSNVVQLALSLESLPDGLKFLLWDGFPQRSLPQNYWPQNLVRLEMRNCHLEQLWEPDRELPKLKRLDLSYSRKLIRIDLYMSPDIEEILLVGCKSLTEVYSSGFLNKLNCLCLNGCDELRSLSIPSNILWRSSGLILVSGCDKLETFSISIRTEVVQLSGCSHHDIFPTGKGWYCQEYPRFCVGDTVPLPYALPSRVLRTFDPVVNIDRHEVEDKEEKKEELCCLDLSNCDSLTSLSFEFDLSKLKFLNKLLLNGCFNFKIFPEIEDTMENLAVLKLDRTAIQALPSSLCRLVALEELSLHYCKRLETIPASIGDLSKLCKLGLTYCVSLETFPSSIFKLKLTELDLSGCSKLRTFPEILEPAQTSAHVYLTETAIKELPFSFGNLVHLQTLRLNMCTDLESLPNSIFKLKLTELDLSGCSKLRTFPEILEPTQNFAHVTLTGTAIKELPFSFGNLVQLQTLRLNMCTDLESLPNSIFKLKLTKLDLSGCSKLRTFPEILEPTQNFAHVTLTGTAIKELPFSFGNLVQLQTLRLNMCTDLESLPNDIVNLNLLSVLDCSGCAKLTEIPNNIGRLSLLRELSLSESGIVNLPESIAHLSSLELLDLTECKKLECIPRLPAFLKQLLAFDCQSITRVMSNSLIQIPSNSKEGGIFRFYFTNGQQLDPGARANIMDESRLRMTEDAYRSVFFCFPGSEVPHWFPFRCEGHSITIHRDSLDFCRNDRLIGFALCAVLQLPDTNDIEGRYILPNNDNLESYFFWRDQERKLDQDHTFLWKYNIESPGMSSMLPHALSFTFEINPYDDDPYDDDDDPYDDDEKLDQDHTFLWKYNIESPGMSMLPHALSFTFEINPYDDDPYDDDDDPYDDDDDDFWPSPSFLSIVRDIKSTVKVKECGICPLYTKEKDDDNNADAGGYSGSVRFSKNGIEEPSGSNVAWKEEAL
ncbi:hypothetical protein JHK85_000314 [Glycine max]|nr:hypothetical protein JHK85_000314 [Glycine max]